MPPTREILPLLAKQRIPTDVSIVAVTSTFEKQDGVREDAMSSGFPQESESANSSVGTARYRDRAWSLLHRRAHRSRSSARTRSSSRSNRIPRSALRTEFILTGHDLKLIGICWRFDARLRRVPLRRTLRVPSAIDR